MPVASDDATDHRVTGNKLAYFNSTLATDDRDPLTRLATIHTDAAFSKARLKALGRMMFEDWSQLAIPLVVYPFKRIAYGFGLGERTKATNNMTISNMPGPAQPYHLHGATLEAFVTCGPPLRGAPLNITLTSYAGQVFVAVTSQTGALPDVEGFTDSIPPILDEMLERLGRAHADAVA